MHHLRSLGCEHFLPMYPTFGDEVAGPQFEFNPHLWPLVHLSVQNQHSLSLSLPLNFIRDNFLMAKLPDLGIVWGLVVDTTGCDLGKTVGLD